MCGCNQPQCPACSGPRNGGCGCSSCAIGMPCTGCALRSEYNARPNMNVQLRPRLRGLGMRAGVVPARVFPPEPWGYQVTEPYAERVVRETIASIAPAGQAPRLIPETSSALLPAPAPVQRSVFDSKYFVPAVVVLALGGTAAIVYNRMH